MSAATDTPATHGTSGGGESRCHGDKLPDRWWRQEQFLRDEYAAHGSLAEAARVHGRKPNTVSKGWWALGLEQLPRGAAAGKQEPAAPRNGERPGVTIRGDWAEFVTDPTPYKLGDMDALLRDRGLDPDDWLVDRATVNEWDMYAGRDEVTNEPRVVKLRQLKATLKRKVRVDWLFPASEVKRRWTAKSTSNGTARETLAVVCGDQQAPYHDEQLHDAFTRWLRDVKPRFGALAGDTIDLPTVSRHADRPHWNANPQRCIDEGFRLLSDYRDASPSTSWRKLRGNHDYRLEAELLSRAERMFGLKPADIPGADQVPGYSIRNLLHLDALGIEMVGREGDKWELAELELAEGISVRHRLPSVEKATRMGRTILAGDSHRQRLRRVTLWPGGRAHVVTLAEVGCLCTVEGLGYTEHPDWQQGFATVSIDTGGVDFATWDGSALTWRGRRW